MINQDEIKTTVDRIEANLRKLGFNDKEVAYWLLRFELTIKKEIGEFILSKLPEEKKAKVQQMTTEKQDFTKLLEFVKENANLTEVGKLYKERLEAIDKELNQWLFQIDSFSEDTREEIRELLSRLSPQK